MDVNNPFETPTTFRLHRAGSRPDQVEPRFGQPYEHLPGAHEVQRSVARIDQEPDVQPESIVSR